MEREGGSLFLDVIHCHTQTAQWRSLNGRLQRHKLPLLRCSLLLVVTYLLVDRRRWWRQLLVLGDHSLQLCIQWAFLCTMVAASTDLTSVFRLVLGTMRHGIDKPCWSLTNEVIWHSSSSTVALFWKAQYEHMICQMDWSGLSKKHPLRIIPLSSWLTLQNLVPEGLGVFRWPYST